MDNSLENYIEYYIHAFLEDYANDSTIKLVRELREKYGRDFELLLLTSLWLSHDPLRKEFASEKVGEIRNFLEMDNRVIDLCFKVISRVIEKLIPWAEEAYEGRIESIEVISYSSDFALEVKLYMLSNNRKRVITLDPCIEPDGLPYLFILCELTPAIIGVCVDCRELKIDNIRVTYLALL